jgi:HAD superfamily hydrolase (TIGR01457 family)
VKAVVIDLDGTIYHGNTLIAGADKAIDLLGKRSKLLFLTNNSTRSREEYVQKLKEFGIHCTKSQVITSGYVSSRYIKQHYVNGNIYVVGEGGLKRELVDQGISLCEENCSVVLVGLDKGFTYEKLSTAVTLIRAGAAFIATNTDPFLITHEQIKPGAGALVAAIERASGREAMVTGKPSRFIGKLILTELKVPAHEILIVGDRLETDILMGLNGGMRTALVLTGASSMNDVEQSNIIPDYIVESIGEIPDLLDYV